MKLHEIMESQFLTDHDEIKLWLNKNNKVKTTKAFSDKKYSILEDGSVDVNGDFHLVQADNVPVKFNKVGGTFSCQHLTLTKISFQIKKCGLFICSYNNLTTMDNFPICEGLDFSSNEIKEFGDFNFPINEIDVSYNKITSLIGIENKILEMKRNLAGDSAAIIFDMDKITEGGIGLLLIPGLDHIMDETGRVIGGFKIIQQHLGDPDSIYDCQEELVNAGYEWMAEL